VISTLALGAAIVLGALNLRQRPAAAVRGGACWAICSANWGCRSPPPHWGRSRTQIDGLLRKWLAILPRPFAAADRAAGYRYEISVLQAEFSLAQVLDRPVSGRVFFEQVIRDNLDIGRSDQASLIFDRRVHRGRKQVIPGRFRTRVITEGVTPSLQVDYKHTAIKQYHKEGRALSTETTINNPGDFRIGKRLTNLPALREVGFTANRRLLRVQGLDHNPIRAAEAFTAVHDPILTADGHRIAGLRLGDPRAHALLHAAPVFRLLPNGFHNRDLRRLLAELLGKQEITAGQMSYDLRRLRAHGLIARIPRTHRYRATDTGPHHGHTHHPPARPAAASRAGPAHRPRTAPAPPNPATHRCPQLPARPRPVQRAGPPRRLNSNLSHHTGPDSIKPTSPALAS
jgi:hypothetical protein